MKKRPTTLRPLAAPGPASTAASPQSLGAILIASDDSDEARSIAALLAQEGWTPRVAASGEEAVRILSGDWDGPVSVPQMVLLGLPVAAPWGRLISEAAAGNGAGARVPLLAVIPKGKGSPEDQSLGERADEILSRPIQPAALLKQVRSLVRLRRLEIESEEHRRANRTSGERLAAMRSEHAAFGHRVAHDLGNPLTGILGHAQMLQLKCTGAMPEVDRYARRILKAARQIQQILADVRDLGLLEEGQMPLHMERVDLRAAISSVVEDHVEGAADDGVKVEAEFPMLQGDAGGPTVRADASLLLRVVSIFIADAVRHTAPDGTVRVHVGAPSDGRVEVHVSDIAAEDDGDPSASPEEPVPAPLARSPRPEHGLRLSFCRAALAAHGGRMWVKPNAAGGDTLGFLLPVEMPTGPVPGR